jgi:hypothetical protein
MIKIPSLYVQTDKPRSTLYSSGQFMNPGPAPRPPTDRPRLNFTPSVSTLPSSVSQMTIQTPTSANSSTTSLLTRSQTEKSGGGAYAVVKDGWAKVKEDGGILRGLVWNDRYLVLREFQLDFLKSNNSPKVASTIQLRDVINITRSESHQNAFELTRTLNSTNGTSPQRDGPTRMIVCKVDTDDEVYSWIDSIYQRCPSMGGVSNPTNFTHRVHVGFDPVSGAFVGLPQEWERLLTASAITKDDYQRNPEAVVEVLNFYTEKLMKRADDPQMYPSLTPTPPVESQSNKQLGYGSSGSSIAPPRPAPPGFSRQESFGTNRADNYSPINEKAAYAQADRDAKIRMEEDRQRRRQEEESSRRREQDRREQERRDREDAASYNSQIPKSRPPMAQQEVSGYGGDPKQQAQPDRYNPSRPPPSAPQSQRDRQQAPSMRQPQQQPGLTAQRTAPSAPKQNGAGAYSQPSQIKPPQQSSTSRQQQQSPNGKYAGTGGAPLSRQPQNGAATQQTRLPAAAPKPLNVQTKAPAAQTEAVKKAEQALTRKEEGGRKEVRMSSMSEAEVMIKLREVVSKERPLDSYNKQKKIGQGASGSVYVARIRENATSPMARKILREQGPKAQVAIKQMDLRNQPRKELIVNEIIVMKESRHDNIVNFLDAFLQEETSELWVVMEFMEGGALTDVIDNNPAITEDQIATVCLEVCVSCFDISRLN